VILFKDYHKKITELSTKEFPCYGMVMKRGNQIAQVSCGYHAAWLEGWLIIDSIHASNMYKYKNLPHHFPSLGNVEINGRTVSVKVFEEYVKKKGEDFFIGVGGGSLSSTARFRMVISKNKRLPKPAWIAPRTERRAAMPNQAYVPVRRGDIILDCFSSGRNKDKILQAINTYSVFLFGEGPDGSPIIYAESVNDCTPPHHLIPFGSILEFYNRDGRAFVS
jgi:hypothetical protein